MDEREFQELHDASMEILKRVGMRFLHPDALEFLKGHGIRVVGQTAFFNENQVMDWASKAPGHFTLHACNPRYDLFLGGDNIGLAPGYGATMIVERQGSIRRASLKDYINFAKLFHQSPHFKVNGGVLVQPFDVPAGISVPVMLYHTILHSDKCLLAAAGNPKETQMVMDMVKILFGCENHLSEKARVITPINTFSPLQMDEQSLSTLMTYAENRQPTMISPCAMGGTTGPMTLAGLIAMSNAEALATIALSQMVAPGAPVLYGFQSTVSDVFTGGVAVGAPERAICIAYGAQLAKKYGLPCRSGGTDTDAQTVSVQSGYESMMTLLTTFQEKVNFVLQAAGTLGGWMAMSYDNFISDLEIIGMVKRLMEGVQINEDTLALDVIKGVGIGGEFLTQWHTVEYCRKEPWITIIGSRGLREESYPDSRLHTKLSETRQDMLAAYEQPEPSGKVNTDLVVYMEEAGLEIKEYTECLRVEA